MIITQFYHVVESKDTMLGICIRYDLNMKQILEFNTLFQNGYRDINKIHVGELIRIQ
jgi:LysM repeat protein